MIRKTGFGRVEVDIVTFLEDKCSWRNILLI